MIRMGADPASRMYRRAARRVSTLSTRSSVERRTRETSDVPMIVAMNQAAIFTPSGRSMIL